MDTDLLRKEIYKITYDGDIVEYGVKVIAEQVECFEDSLSKCKSHTEKFFLFYKESNRVRKEIKGSTSYEAFHGTDWWYYVTVEFSRSVIKSLPLPSQTKFTVSELWEIILILDDHSKMGRYDSPYTLAYIEQQSCTHSLWKMMLYLMGNGGYSEKLRTRIVERILSLSGSRWDIELIANNKLPFAGMRYYDIIYSPIWKQMKSENPTDSV